MGERRDDARPIHRPAAPRTAQSRSSADPIAAACPSNCIYIEAAENTAENRVSGAERYAKVYNIDYNRCIFCGYCVEACPTDAITHGHGFELATFSATNLVMRARGDYAQVTEFKQSVVEALRAHGFELRLAFEDDPSNHAMYVAAGIPCVYIHSGYYE